MYSLEVVLRFILSHLLGGGGAGWLSKITFENELRNII